MSRPIIDHFLQRAPLPDRAVRPALRAGVAARLLRERAGAISHGQDPRRRFADARSAGPIAIATESANEQHYEVPARLFELMLGPRMKYSACLWEPGYGSLGQAEEAMLALTCRRAGVAHGQRVLDLGCGWGSLSLWIAERWPSASVTAVSNSASQRRFILARAAEAGLDNVEVVTADVNRLELAGRYDRVISIEMFEHVRNHAALLERVARHLAPGGSVFVHVFAHRRHGYEFEDTWMTRRFFSGGVMPVHGWLGQVGSPLEVSEQWWLDGAHYARTATAWLDNLDANRDAALATLVDAYGARDAPGRLREWRLFLLACTEIFGFRQGREYGMSHVLLHPR